LNSDDVDDDYEPLFSDAQPISEETSEIDDAVGEGIGPVEIPTVDENARQRDFREDYPTAVYWLFEKQGRNLLIDFAVDEAYESQQRSFSKQGLANAADVSRKTVYEHIDDLVEAGIYKEIENGNTKYQPDASSDTLRLLAMVNEELVDRFG
jgi:hypothetical protein